MDRSEIIIGMKVGHESGHSQTDDFEPGAPRNDGINKVKTDMFLCSYARWVPNAFQNFVLLWSRIRM